MSEQLRLGVIGAGRAFERLYLPALGTGSPWRLAAIADPDPGRRAIGEAAGATGFADGDGLVAAGGLDALAVLSPPAVHVEHAGAALAAGLPVLIEKPVATELEPLRRWHQAGWLDRVTPAFPRRFWPAYQRLRVRTANALDITLGIRTDPAGWSAITSHGVHPLVDLGPHLMDLARWLTGMEPSRLTIETGRSGAHLRLEGDGRVVSVVVLHAAQHGEVARVDGKSIRLGPPTAFESAVRRLRKQSQPESEAMVTMLARWAARVRGDAAPGLPGPRDAWASVAIIEAAMPGLAASALRDVPVSPYPG